MIIGVSSNSTFVRIVINDHESMVPFVDLQQNLCLADLKRTNFFSLSLISFIGNLKVINFAVFFSKETTVISELSGMRENIFTLAV